MADWHEYMKYAEECLSIARTASDRETRVMLRVMAAEWTNLAVARDNEQHSDQHIDLRQTSRAI